MLDLLKLASLNDICKALLVLVFVSALPAADECWVDVYSFDGRATPREALVLNAEIITYSPSGSPGFFPFPLRTKLIGTGVNRLFIDRSMQNQFARLIVAADSIGQNSHFNVVLPKCGGMLTVTPGKLQSTDDMDRSVYGVLHRKIVGFKFRSSNVYIVKAVALFGGKSEYSMPEALVDQQGEFILSGYLGEGRLTLLLTENGSTIGYRDLDFEEYKNSKREDIAFVIPKK